MSGRRCYDGGGRWATSASDAASPAQDAVVVLAGAPPKFTREVLAQLPLRAAQALLQRALRLQGHLARLRLLGMRQVLRLQVLREQEALAPLPLRLAQVLLQRALLVRAAQENQTSGVLLTSHRHLTGLRLMTLKPQIGQT